MPKELRIEEPCLTVEYAELASQARHHMVVLKLLIASRIVVAEKTDEPLNTRSPKRQARIAPICTN